MKKTITFLLVCVLVLCLFPMSSYAATSIDSADMTIDYPVHLATPSTLVYTYGGAFRVDSQINSDGYKNGIRWKELSSNKVMSASDIFVGGKEYELSICIFANSGFAFSASSTVASINGDTASLSVKDVNHARATVKLTADKLYINSVDVTGLSAPAVGKTPDFSFTISENCSYRGVSWYDLTGDAKISNTTQFRADSKYKVAFDLLADNGYTFPDNVSVYINGKAATVTANGGYQLKVQFEYPKLAAETVHTHKESNWRITGAYHYTVCTVCGDMLEQEDHMGGKATCAEGGKCSVCGYEYLEATENHKPDTTKWVARVDMYHFHKCKLCGAHCDISDHNPGPAATDNEPQKCLDCGYILVPAKNHTHELTKVAAKEPTCMEPGNIEYYTCSGCSAIFGENDVNKPLADLGDTVVGALGHKTSDDWKSDNEFHWRTCTVCNAVLDETKMVHEMEDEACLTCGYTDGSDFGWIWIAVISAALLLGAFAVVAAVIVVVSVIIIKNRKKKAKKG